MRATKKEEKPGYAEGRDFGYAEGRDSGHKEEKIEIAKNMLRKGSNIEFIMECTGLKREELELLKDDTIGK